MSGEVIAFSDLFNAAITLTKELGTVTLKAVPVQIRTDSKLLFDIISAGSTTSEKRLMSDIALTRKGFKDKRVPDIGFVRATQSAADRRTGSTSQGLLRQVTSSCFHHVRSEQWILRS